MNMKLKRSIALLLLVCTVVSLFGTAAFATGGETAADGTAAQSASVEDGTSTPADGGEEDKQPGEGDAPSDGGPDQVTLTFYDYSGSQITSFSRASGEKLTTEELTAISGYDTSYWLYGIHKEELTSSCTTAALTNLAPDGNWDFYAAHRVTYKDPDGNEIANSEEYVLPNSTPKKAPTAVNGKTITGWTKQDGENWVSATLTGESAETITKDITFKAVVADSTPTTGKAITLTFYDYDGKTELTSTIGEYHVGDTIDTKSVPVSTYGGSKGEVVSGWLMQVGDDKTMTEVYDLATVKPTEDTTFYAAWKVSYRNGMETEKSLFKTELVRDGEKPAKVPTELSGKTISGWVDIDKEKVTPAEQKIVADTEFTAWVNPELSTVRSTVYATGYADASGNTYYFQPDGKLTRAQAATMLYKLLDTSENGNIDVSFSDVASTAWYAEYIELLASYGLLSGTEKGEFEPTRSITRAEFVKMICNIYGTKTYTEKCPFTDVAEYAANGSKNWYYDAIMTAYKDGWITGYKQSDGTYRFERQKPITRAEAVTILNRVIGRTPTTAEKTTIKGYTWRIFADLTDNHWAFYDIMQATTGCGQAIPTTGLSAGRHKINVGGVYYYFFVDSSGRFIAQSKGLHEMSDGKSYYISSAGGGARVYSAGVYSLGGDLYLLNSDGSVIREPRSGYEARVYEYNNRMYYIQEDGTLLQNESYGVLYFGNNGAYTSGDSTLDSWLNWFVKDIAASSKGQEDKLYDAYVSFRDYPARRLSSGYYGYAYCSYAGKSYQDMAAEFFQKARGDCGFWAMAMVYVAERLGYQAWYTTTTLRSGADHAVEVIQVNGTKYIFDVQQEWGRMYGYFSAGRSDRDCWKMEYKPNEYICYGTRFAGTTYGSAWAGEVNVWSPYKFTGEYVI